MEENGHKLVCDCGMPARLQISTTEKNPGRKFHCCWKRSNQCDYFEWVDDDIDWVVKGLRTELKVVKEELDAVSAELVEAKILIEAKKDEIQMINDETEGLKESHEMYVEENQIMFEETGLLLMEIETLKDQMKLTEVRCADFQKSNKIMKIGFGVAFAIAGCSVGLVLFKTK